MVGGEDVVGGAVKWRLIPSLDGRSVASMLNPASVLRRRDVHLSGEVDGEILFLCLETGKYVGLDPVGSCIWHLLDQPCSLETLCERLVERYDVSPATCLDEVRPFIDGLVANRLIDIA